MNFVYGILRVAVLFNFENVIIYLASSYVTIWWFMGRSLTFLHHSTEKPVVFIVSLSFFSVFVFIPKSVSSSSSLSVPYLLASFWIPHNPLFVPFYFNFSSLSRYLSPVSVSGAAPEHINALTEPDT